MTVASFTEQMAMHILERERFAIRFEDFCIQLMSEHDGETYVRTSRSYDLGRDGRGTRPAHGRVPPYICCGTDGKPLEKATEDAKRLSEFESPKHLVFCFTDSSFSEDKANKIETAVRNVFPNLETVRSFGSFQLAQVAVHHPDVFERWYAADIQELRDALATATSKEEIELTGLRVALTTQLSEDAQGRRQDILRNLILTALSDGKPLTADGIAKVVSDKLKLPRIVNVGWLHSQLSELVFSKQLDSKNKAYLITDIGRNELSKRTAQGSASLLDGRSKIYDLITELTGSAASEGEFRQVWNILLDGLTTMFLNHGAQIVESIASILGGASTISECDGLRGQIERIADRIRGISGGGTRIEEVSQAIVDMFSESTSPAFDWLANICEVFLQLCTLGLEPASQEQIGAHLKEIDLLLDTDIVISLLSEGEANHVSTKAIVTGWRSIGGGILVSEPVLEEVAHHAWMSKREFDRLSTSLDGMTDTERGQLVINAFVRGFMVECKRMGESCTLRRWNQYIAAFKGRHDLDFDNVLALMQSDRYGFLSEKGADATLAKAIEEDLCSERKERLGSNAAALNDLRQKASRDGRLLSLLSWHRSEIRRNNRMAYIVSGGLRQGADALQKRTGDREPVIFMAAVAWFLSLVPGVRLNSTNLRTVLFDADIRLRMDPLERATLRYIHASDQYKMQLSRRATLKQAVRQEIKRRAEEFHLSEADLERRIINPEEEDMPIVAKIVGAAVDQVALSESERKIGALQAENSQLRSQLEKERKRSKKIRGQ